MYLEHFKLNTLPFSLAPNTQFYCSLTTHNEALNVLLLSLGQGEGFIKIIGEVGTGKTMLCRMLLNSLDHNYVTAYIPNPDQNGHSLRLSLAHELGLKVDTELAGHQLLELINYRLLELHKAGIQTVLIIDEAQALPDESLEAVRLLTNLETEEKKLLQVVLFGQPELDDKLYQNNMRQLLQRITFSYRLNPLNPQELDKYIYHRLAKAGYTYGMIFSEGARKQLYRASGGLPRVLNVLCHKALLVAYGRGLDKVDTKSMKRAISDTECISLTGNWLQSNWQIILTVGICIAAILLVYWELGIIA
jgi:MSHA biogenesis protein MshM